MIVLRPEVDEDGDGVWEAGPHGVPHDALDDVLQAALLLLPVVAPVPAHARQEGVVALQVGLVSLRGHLVMHRCCLV